MAFKTKKRKKMKDRHEGGDASGRQVFPDQPLGAVPVEALGGVSDAGEVYAGFTEENEKQTKPVN